MLNREEVLKFVQSKGPVLPRDVVKELGGDTFLTGALLSQLSDSKLIKISHAKIGGSPVYYVPGQEGKLEDLYKFLHEKEKKAFDALKSAKLIRDSTAEPVMRVALRAIRDFAKPIEVNISGQKELFWKWHLTPNADAESLLKDMFKVREEPQKQQPIEQPEMKQEATPKEVKQEVQKKLEPKKEQGSSFISRAEQFFSEKNIEIVSKEIVRKSSELNYIIKIPSPVGRLKYYCKIKDKKKSSDKDITSAYVEAQMKKHPLLYLTTGELTKKAKEMIEAELDMVSFMTF